MVKSSLIHFRQDGDSQRFSKHGDLRIQLKIQIRTFENYSLTDIQFSVEPDRRTTL